MPEHVEQFSIFAAAIIDRLYDVFPIGIDLSSSDFVESTNISELFAVLDRRLESVPRDGSFTRANIASDEGRKIADKVRQDEETRSIFRGTLEFLISEGFVRCTEPYPNEGIYRGCQLTAKGFSHLHLEFKDKNLGGESSSVIKWIKGRFWNASAVEGAVLVAIISKYIAG